MVEKLTNQASGTALDFGKLLGFKHLAVYSGRETALARALGTTCNKVGETTFQRRDSSPK
jgi:hypothetical protein